MFRSASVFGALLSLTVAFAAFAADEVVSAAVGKSAPDFEVQGIDGKPFRLSQKLAKDQNVVLVFSRAHW